MSGYNRYKILKKCFNNNCILFINKDCFNSYDIDRKIIINNKEKYLENKNISYIIVDNLTIIKIYNACNNLYDKYFYYYGIKEILDKIKNIF